MMSSLQRFSGWLSSACAIDWRPLARLQRLAWAIDQRVGWLYYMYALTSHDHPMMRARANVTQLVTEAQKINKH